MEHGNNHSCGPFEKGTIHAFIQTTSATLVALSIVKGMSLKIINISPIPNPLSFWVQLLQDRLLLGHQGLVLISPISIVVTPPS